MTQPRRRRRTAPDRAEPAAERAPVGLSHVQEGRDGARSRMVDVGAKSAEPRSALARALVCFPPGLRDLAWRGKGPKGPIAEVARCAGLLAAKRTAELVPLCHPLPLDHLEIDIEPLGEDHLEIRCTARTVGRTGVEMEALVGASLAALTVYDMTKALDKGIRIECVELLEKSGGKSGGWKATPAKGAARRRPSGRAS